MKGAYKKILNQKKPVGPVRLWTEREGVISFWVKTDGTTGSEWITRLEKKGLEISEWAKNALLSAHFKPTKDVAIDVAILKAMIFYDEDRTMPRIRAKALERELSLPSLEVACLIREKFSDQDIVDMGLDEIIVMHEPLKNEVGDLEILVISKMLGQTRLELNEERADVQMSSGAGFAFVAGTITSAELVGDQELPG